MVKFFKNDIVISFFHTFITDLVWDQSVGIAVSHITNSNDFSRGAWFVLGYTIFRTFLRTIRDDLKKRFPNDQPSV